MKSEDPNIDDTTPLYEQAARDGRMPRIPDIQKERHKWDLLSFPLKKGDVTVTRGACTGAPPRTQTARSGIPWFCASSGRSSSTPPGRSRSPT